MSEAFYDSQIAPELLRLSKICQENGISMLAVCEFEPGETGRTQTIQPGAGAGFLLTAMAAKANGNLDALAMSAARKWGDTDHGSFVLASMTGGGQ